MISAAPAPQNTCSAVTPSASAKEGFNKQFMDSLDAVARKMFWSKYDSIAPRNKAKSDSIKLKETTQKAKQKEAEKAAKIAEKKAKAEAKKEEKQRKKDAKKPEDVPQVVTEQKTGGKEGAQ